MDQPQLFRSNWGFSALLKGTSTCSLRWRSNPVPAGRDEDVMSKALDLDQALVQALVQALALNQITSNRLLVH
ncbi:hypothetical protein EYF80_057811 [Liparis tanakae]|uniref:Uncharacterized protein n=1 Tax=Liparis tanakae TaxID=230148 RepID=A0A4Z2EUV0_9TELE|nr:hypothetical protein EYF80_057811 [Liparis tanakae]